ncbi:hypothetical protein [Lacticaseibacillus porcinae]|uniref:hypothetical protein n=1 Tax=Lacticaseibacillus porcinae TaxID=1123687 RepID=UPI000F7B53CA|nr:hypothetical protein [Lacticaseibacillus porcinae]
MAQLIGIGISSGVMAVVSRIRSETIRWQDSHMRRIDNTSKIIAFYNNEIRKLVIVFMREFDKEAVQFKPKSDKGAGALRLQIQFQLDLATKLELATILHLLDHLGWLLKQTSYLYQEEILYSIASELKRLLLNEQYEVVILQLLRHSSIRNLDYLIEKLKEVPTHDEK